MKKFLSLLGFDESKQTTVRTEIVAGIVTFLAMAYILTVNPAQILVGVTVHAVARSRPLLRKSTPAKICRP